MENQKVITLADYQIDTTGTKDVTVLFQELLNLASKEKARLIIPCGTYLVSPLFISSNTTLEFEKGAVLLGSTDETQYKDIFTRVAGIEMNWYPAILNCLNSQNITIKGDGIINGQGPYWWAKFWGKDQKGGYREKYSKLSLRWAADYECKRPRNLLVSNCSNIHIENLLSQDSGFWNYHILYSENIYLDNLKVTTSLPSSPSTDGIDIDSCSHVFITNCELSCDDDSICIKSGRDVNGLLVNRPCKDIHISNCTLNQGYGITFGSELSGGIEDIFISNIIFNNSSCGLRIKSSINRKGYVKNITCSHLKMHNVKYLFNFCLDWNRGYSICQVSKDYIKEDHPEYYKWLIATSPSSLPPTKVSNINIDDVVSTYLDSPKQINRVFNIIGFEESPIEDITFTNMDIKAKEFGVIKYVKNFNYNKEEISTLTIYDPTNDNFDNR